MSSVRHARPDTEGERLTSTSQHLVTHRDRVVHRFAQSGVARRCTGVQSLGYGPDPHAERVIESRFEAVISMHSNRRSLVRAVAVVTVVELTKQTAILRKSGESNRPSAKSGIV